MDLRHIWLLNTGELKNKPKILTSINLLSRLFWFLSTGIYQIKSSRFSTPISPQIWSWFYGAETHSDPPCNKNTDGICHHCKCWVVANLWNMTTTLQNFGVSGPDANDGLTYIALILDKPKSSSVLTFSTTT